MWGQATIFSLDWGGWQVPSLCSPSAPPRSSVSLRKEVVYMSGALAFVSAAQRTHPLLDQLCWSVGLVFMGSTGIIVEPMNTSYYL